jgi:predicted phosphate transport protein (TIGR00153 family)
MSAYKLVANAITAWIDGEDSINKDDLKKVTEIEVKADSIKSTIINELAKANSLMQREDLLRLVHYHDKIADGSEWCLYHLDFIAPVWRPEGKLREQISKCCKLLTSEITQQREAVRFLSMNMEESMKRADAVCRLEKDIDVVVRKIMTLLYPAEIPLPILLRVRDLLNMLEDIANFGEDAAITIRTLSLTLNT